MEKFILFIKKYQHIIFLFCFSFVIRLFVIWLVKTPIESDFRTMYDASIEIINGTSLYKSSSYFLTWGYQMGHVLYQSLLLSLINSVTFLKVVNSFITSLIVVFIYLIGKMISSERVAFIVSILYSIFLFPLLLNTVLTNQHLPVLLTLISIYILININYDKYLFKSLFVGVLLGISNILRSEGIVIIAAIFVYSLYLITKKYNYKKIIISFVLIVSSYFLVFNGTSFILEKTNISSNGLKNMNSTWKFVLGFNYDTNGMYSEDDAILYANDKEKAKDIVIERVKDYKKIPMLFIKKSKILWFNSDLSWSLGYISDSLIYKILNIINQVFIIVFDLLAIVGIYSLFKNKDKILVLISLILFMYFGVYLLIEVMPRYAYSLQVFEAILSCATLDLFIKKYVNKQLT